jgi:Carboxypeptidase regulatory-like domain
MSALSFKKNGFGPFSLATTRWRRITLGGCILAISLTAVLRGGAEVTAAPASNVGFVDGTVEDVSGAIVPKAELTLKCPLPCRAQTTLASDTGGFEFRNLTLGIAYQVTATVDGFKEWTSPTILLTADRSSVLLSDVRLQLEAVSSVTVYASQEEMATEQVRIEEQQRVLGIVPNFYVVYNAKDAVPLSTKLKFKLAMKVSMDPITVAGIGLFAGMQQAGGTPNYTGGAKGYGQRFGAAAASSFSDILVGGAVLPTLLHQDPRYFYQGTGTTSSRLRHALFSPFIARGDNGRPQVNFSSLGGNLASSALNEAYYPDSNRGPGLVFGNFAIGTGERMLSAVVQEFVLRRLTPAARKQHYDNVR